MFGDKYRVRSLQQNTWIYAFESIIGLFSNGFIRIIHPSPLNTPRYKHLHSFHQSKNTLENLHSTTQNTPSQKLLHPVPYIRQIPIRILITPHNLILLPPPFPAPYPHAVPCTATSTQLFSPSLSYRPTRACGSYVNRARVSLRMSHVLPTSVHDLPWERIT